MRSQLSGTSCPEPLVLDSQWEEGEEELDDEEWDEDLDDDEEWDEDLDEDDLDEEWEEYEEDFEEEDEPHHSRPADW